MSIISNEWYELPSALDLRECGAVNVDEPKGQKRRSLFDSGLSWDHGAGQAVVNRFTGLLPSVYASGSDEEDVYGPVDDVDLEGY